MAASTRMSFALLGPPGSGKGTYGRMLAESLPATLVTTSDVLRRMQTGEHEDVAVKGGLMDDGFVSNALLDFLKEQRVIHGYHIIDGFPRTLKQVQIMEETWPKQFKVNAAVSLDIPRSVCRAKLLGRRLCQKCGGNFNIADVNIDGFVLPPTLPDDCDCNREDWVTREDDHPDIVDNRLDLYYSTTSPVLQHFESSNSLLRSVLYRGYKDMPDFSRTLKKWLEDYQDR